MEDYTDAELVGGAFEADGEHGGEEVGTDGGSIGEIYLFCEVLDL